MRRARCAASRGALPMIAATSSSSAGLALNSEKSCTPAGRLPRKRSKFSSAWSGAAVEPSAFRSAGISSVSSSRARAVRGRAVAAVMPARARCPRPPPDRGSPALRASASVPGSSSVPVKTRLPPGRRGSAPPRTAGRSGLRRNAGASSRSSWKDCESAIAQEGGDRRHAGLVVGQAVGLLVVDHLQAVLDLAQEAVGLDQLVGGARRDVARRPRARAASRRSPRRRSAGLRPPKISCWVWAKNSISRMPPRPSLTLWPSTLTALPPRWASIWRLIEWMSWMAAKSRCLRQM